MSTFNKEQQALIDAPLSGKVIGVAGAGTGKTTTVLGRVRRILNEIKTGNIVLITFTRMAAQDLQKRLRITLNEQDMRRVRVGTFHSTIGALIRDHAVSVGLQPSFSVLDETSSKVMIRSVIENNDAFLSAITDVLVGPDGVPRDSKHKTLIKRDFNKIAMDISTVVNTAYPKELMTGVFGEETLVRLSKQLGYDQDLLQYGTLPEGDNLPQPFVRTLYDIFKESLMLGRQTNTITYDQILFIGYLMTQTDILNAFKDSIVHMIVDEYQDTNLLQDAFVRHIGGDHLTIVGDIDQAIYEFRGGKAELLEEHSREGTVINLTLNYRSHQQILDAGNAVIDYNESGRGIRKPLRAFRNNDGSFGGLLALKSDDDHKEADIVIQRIQFLHSQGVAYKDIAILVRSRMAIPAINQALGKTKIPVNDTTQFADFMKSDVMTDTLNFIKIFTNPKDIYAFMAVLDRPKRGIGPKAVQTLQLNAAEHGLSVIEYLLSDHIKTLTTGLRNKVSDFVTVYETLTDEEHQHMAFPDMVDFLLTQTGYKAWAAALKNSDKYDANFTILEGMVEEFDKEYAKSHENYTLFDIANAFTFEMTGSIRQEDIEGVNIATIHGSKGLEWSHVFVLGMENELFPGTRLVDQADMESERRLMYVAATRAKDSLWLCGSRHRIAYPNGELSPSQFLQEIGELPERYV